MKMNTILVTKKKKKQQNVPINVVYRFTVR